MDYNEYWTKIYKESEDLNSIITTYWRHFSDWGHWQFWVVVAMFVIPLIVVYFKVDRARIFEIFFFGYTGHMLWGYSNLAMENMTVIVRKYFLIPPLQTSIAMTASLLPASYLLLYQYCTNKNKNFYLYTIGLSAVFAFGVVPIERWLDLIDIRKGMNFFYIFLNNVAVGYLSYWFTKFVIKVKNKGVKTEFNFNLFKNKAR
ncbi:hypothetical protein BEP19_02215 [Ammoniphilus oxalaticus]|uniref:Uncharacterized protein n=1 Tax=Ammoniphilus oxalaticus TaxID=66863 RepID=A0A419SNA4_9BACL|nr:hypothetical protein [Ammoniphilus oxalaticus]RKD25776.1 hypothetical protein BEP19_02215 [Ammoniphilus oxalaticus]